MKLRSLARGDFSQESCHYSIQDSVVIIAHGRETSLEQSGKKRMGGIQRRLILKGHEECPSDCLWREKLLDVEIGDTMGQGRHFNDYNP